jgi:hypothetical protein
MNMARPIATAMLGRLGAGRGAWSIAAFLFPTLALVEDGRVAIAMLLFVMETLLASALLGARIFVASRASHVEPDAQARLREIRRLLLILVLPFSLVCGVMLGAVTLIEHANTGRFEGQAATFVSRASWMAGVLLASAVLDAVVAPVRSVPWLEATAAWQWSRTAVLFLTMLIGWPVMLFSGTSQAFAWIFFAFRLLTDVATLMPGERERIRGVVFGGPREPDLTTRDVAKPPPPFSRSHARHAANDPGRLPD